MGIYSFLIFIRDFINVIASDIFYTVLAIIGVLSLVYFVITFVMMFYKNKDGEKEFDMDDAPFVTVQIPTYNEIVALKCAKKCLNFDYPKDKYEILIGDDSNKKEISRAIDEFAKKHDNIRVIRRANNYGYKSGNLNNMLKYSKGDIIVLFDSDFSPNRDFLKRIVSPMVNNKKIVAVQARWGFLNANQNLITKLASSILSVFHYLILPFLKRSKISFICGSAEAVRKDVLLKLNGWEHGSMTEDIEYSLKLLKNGYKIAYLEDLECKGELPFTLKDFRRQQTRWAYGVTRAFAKHGKDILFSKRINVVEKLSIYFIYTGYMMTFLLVALVTTGIIKMLTTAPAPFDFNNLIYETARNIFLTSGLLFAGLVAISKSKYKSQYLKTIVSSFSYGLITIYFVTMGIVKAVLNKPMKWYMLNKKGNKVHYS